ncbi:NTH1 [Ecytonucleospora hepatopenaei]|uniref:NTH1 n=1 Tax=Ecytonucleospora hepatopenaei TaxID=646526 RepID=A0A1W0E3A2_9MICR|nr:NTH1 [Ecytonucleospora hepatopenaei]
MQNNFFLKSFLSLKSIFDQRNNIKAPVDSFGCHIVQENQIDSDEYKLHILIKLILSVQSKDENTHKCYLDICRINNNNIFLNRRLLTDYHLNNGDNLQENKRTKILEGKKINKVNFFNKKMQVIKEIFSNKNLSLLLNNPNELIKLKGIGNKIISLYTQHALFIFTEIPVDLHVHRILNRIGMVDCKNSNMTDLELRKNKKQIISEMGNLSAKQNNQNFSFKPENINAVLVGFGQVVCTAKNPKCKECYASSTCKFYLNKFSF